MTAPSTLWIAKYIELVLHGTEFFEKNFISGSCGLRGLVGVNWSCLSAHSYFVLLSSPLGGGDGDLTLHWGMMGQMGETFTH